MTVFALIGAGLIGIIVGLFIGTYHTADTVASEIIRCAKSGGLYAGRYKIISMRLCPVCPELKDCPHADNRTECWEYDRAISKIKGAHNE